jgi:hypothetical protein
MKTEFTLLHYPLYWHYNILFGLRSWGKPDLSMIRAAVPRSTCSSRNDYPTAAGPPRAGTTLSHKTSS